MVLRTRLREAASSITPSDAGSGVLGGSGLATLVASVAGMCPFCVVGLPCPVCALGATSVIGGLFGGAGVLGWHDGGDGDDAADGACCGTDAGDGCGCCRD